jgi:hypothetical protein
MRVYSITFINIFLLCCLSCIFQNCAVQIPPTGGPRDSIAPILTNATIKDSTTNFNASSITFKFNEYIEGADISNNLIINPLPKKQPTVTTRLNSFTINLKDSLLPNTTYTLSVKNGIKDLNEGNKIENFSYLFSTGSTFDNGVVAGTIYNAATGAIDSTLTVMLYSNMADSAIALENPLYITNTKGNGTYNFNNIAPGTYKLYAYEATKGSYTYNNTDKKFAFFDETITVANDASTNNKDLYAYMQEKETTTPTVTTAKENAGKPGDEKNEDKRLKFTNSLSDNKQDILSELTLNFNRHIITLDTAYIKLTANNKPVLFTTTIDTTDKRKIKIAANWVENTSYSLLLQKAFVTDTTKAQYYKQQDTLSFTTKKLSDYGSLEIIFSNLPNSNNLLLEIKRGETLVKSEYLKSNRFFIKVFEPGEYSASIIVDNNKNKKWDSGNYFKNKLQPEKIIRVPEKVAVRANFDKSYNIKL